MPGDGSRPLESLDGAKIAVVGLGASGRAAARLALERGGTVYATDQKTDAETTAVGDQLRSLGARVELGDHRLERFLGADAVVVSPGIPPEAPVLRDLRRAGERWISELEFAFRFFQGPLIAVTGTNGKTTTAALTAHLLRQSGYRVGLGGNIGAGLGPAASELALMGAPPERYVVEASSFQLADVEWFRPDVGVVTNLAPDHLDRYPDTAAYYADKKRLFENATRDCHWVLNGDDPGVLELARGAPGRRHLFRVAATDEKADEDERAAGDEKAAGVEKAARHGKAARHEQAAGDEQAAGVEHPGGGAAAFLRGDDLVVRWAPEPSQDLHEMLLPRDALPLMGRHNAANALAAALAAGLGGATPGAVESGLRSFASLPHRLEPVAEVEGILWVDDSKATNVSASVSAVESLDRPVVLLLGGKDKGEDFRRLRAVGGSGVRSVVAYGAAGGRIADALEGAVEVRRVDGTFEQAVRAGLDAARPGDILLLSPACSSYDMFESYEARGRRFRELAETAARENA